MKLQTRALAKLVSSHLSSRLMRDLTSRGSDITFLREDLASTKPILMTGDFFMDEQALCEALVDYLSGEKKADIRAQEIYRQLSKRLLSSLADSEETRLR